MISVRELLLRSAKEKGNVIAAKDAEREINYAELMVQSYMVSEDIKQRIRKRNSPVMIITKKSVETLIAIWGVVCSGNFYVTVDGSAPVGRMKMAIEQIKPEMVLYTDEKDVCDLSEEICRMKVSVCEKGHIEINDVINALEKNLGIDEDPLYCVFSSGSTGIPKAIIKTHRSILSFVEAFVSTFQFKFEKQEIFGNQANFDFDVAAKDIYISAALGATLCIIPKRCFLAPRELAAYINDNKITTLIWAASAIKYVSRFRCFDRVIPTELRNAFFSGESMPGDIIGYWRELLPMCRLVNLYAPSEVTGNCMYHVVTEEEYDTILPLDKCFKNIDVMILDEKEKEVSDGEKGEIYVRGAFLSKGYYNDFVKTKESFIQNPLQKKYPEIVYRTGDFVRKQGERLYFVGRVDNQIKHMGHRIELEEIEANVCKIIPRSNCCIVYDGNEEKLVLLTDDKDLSYEELVKKLGSVLPKYMIPHKLLKLGCIPMNDRGKLDRNRAFQIYTSMEDGNEK